MKLSLICKFSTWKIGSIAFTGLILLPIFAIFYTALAPLELSSTDLSSSDNLFAHLNATVMPTYLWNTICLTFGVMLLSLLLGVPSAWFMAMCHLPTARYLQWALVLPLAMPGYIIGYIFTDWFDFAGPLQIILRDITGWQGGEYWFPDLRSLPGAVWVLGLVLYPYVYLLCRSAFLEQSNSLLESACLLKCTPWQSFWRLSLPLVRPAIAVGLSLVAMETIGDFGTVSYFSVSTLTTAIYDTWLGYANLSAAAKISSMMLVMVILLLSLERYSRRKQQLFQMQSNQTQNTRYHLQGWKKWLALSWCWGIVGVAFLLPLFQLMMYAWHYFSQNQYDALQIFAWNSFSVSFIAAVIAIIVAVIVTFSYRISATPIGLSCMRLSTVGYAVPGTVLAIGVMVPVLFIEHRVNDFAIYMQWSPPGLFLSGSMIALIFALVVRFTAVAVGSVESHLNKIAPSLDMAARTMGCRANQMLWKIHLPLVRRGILVAGLLVFIESMKELNAALLLRPFNFETLATYVYNFASDEQLELAALPAILLVVVGLIPLILINRSLEKTSV